MKNEPITLETALLAKEKGFNILIPNFYTDQTSIGKDVQYSEEGVIRRNYNAFEFKVSAPSQSLLQRWLREIHNIDITVSLVATQYGFYIHKNRDYTNNGESYSTLGVTYEEVLESALKEALKLI